MGIFRGCGREGLHQGDKGGVQPGGKPQHRGGTEHQPRGEGNTGALFNVWAEKETRSCTREENMIKLTPEEDELHRPCQRQMARGRGAVRAGVSKDRAMTAPDVING